jgi:hypothetical protein
MAKVLESCMGALLRADLTGHSRPTLFGRNWPCPFRLALKRTPVQDFNSFSIIINTTYQKIGDLFCPVHISGLSQGVISRYALHTQGWRNRGGGGPIMPPTFLLAHPDFQSWPDTNLVPGTHVRLLLFAENIRYSVIQTGQNSIVISIHLMSVNIT